MTNEDIRKKLSKILLYPDCPKFWESDTFPIPSSIGEGHEFMIRDEKYITTSHYPNADDNNKKRKITANITTYAGMCGGARHYYCKIDSKIYNVSESGVYSFGYLGGYKIPQEFTSIEFELGREVTEEMIAEDPARWEYYHPGYMTNAFESKEDIYNLIDFLKANVFTEDSWEWKIKGMV